jgi:Uma2 family endonuclease
MATDVPLADVQQGSKAQVRLNVPRQLLPAKLAFDPDLRMNDEEYYQFCMANRDVRIERSAQGDIIVMPPAGWESDHQSLNAGAQLHDWAIRDGRGKVSGATAAFILPTGAALSPDAAWVSNHRLAQLSREQRRKFLPICPEFVIELMSPSDRLPAAQQKMEEWVRAGVELAWLIQPDEKTIFIYRAGRSDAEVRTEILTVAGEGPVAGFELELGEIWAGL